tara:strand:+ start:356 stop:769 length:414 start_codon:yes stop_codon:yes gene_type:complete
VVVEVQLFFVLMHVQEDLVVVDPDLTFLQIVEVVDQEMILPLVHLKEMMEEMVLELYRVTEEVLEAVLVPVVAVVQMQLVVTELETVMLEMVDLEFLVVLLVHQQQDQVVAVVDQVVIQVQVDLVVVDQEQETHHVQ